MTSSVKDYAGFVGGIAGCLIWFLRRSFWHLEYEFYLTTPVAGNPSLSLQVRWSLLALGGFGKERGLRWWCLAFNRAKRNPNVTLTVNRTLTPTHTHTHHTHTAAAFFPSSVTRAWW